MKDILELASKAGAVVSGRIEFKSQKDLESFCIMINEQVCKELLLGSADPVAHEFRKRVNLGTANEPAYGWSYWENLSKSYTDAKELSAEEPETYQIRAVYSVEQLAAAALRAREFAVQYALEEAAVLCAEIKEYPAGHTGQWEGYGPVRATRSGEECAEALRELKKEFTGHKLLF